MELTEYRERIDALDREIIALLEARMDVAAGIAAYKQDAGLAILDTAREQVKLDAVRSRCRKETADLIADVFTAILAASRSHQARCMEDRHGG